VVLRYLGRRIKLSIYDMCEMGVHMSVAYHLIILSSTLNIEIPLISRLLRPTERFCTVSC